MRYAVIALLCLVAGCAPQVLVVVDKAADVCASVKEVSFEKSSGRERTRIVCGQ